MNVEGRTAVITGASRGLGAGLAAAFHARGMRLGLCARSQPDTWQRPPGIQTWKTDPRACALAVDVRDPAAVEAFAQRVSERFGAIDLWINNAGVLDPIGPLRDLDSSRVREHLEINVLGVVAGCQAFVRHLRARGGEGVLINVSSGAGRRPYAGWSSYCAAKAAVDRLTECVQLEEGTAGLRAYSIAPGVIETAMQEKIRATSEEVFPEVERFRELARTASFSRPEFIAQQFLSIAFDPAQRPDAVLTQIGRAHV